MLTYELVKQAVGYSLRSLVGQRVQIDVFCEIIFHNEYIPIATGGEGQLRDIHPYTLKSAGGGYRLEGGMEGGDRGAS